MAPSIHLCNHGNCVLCTDDVEAQVCPVILDLAQADSVDDFRTEAVAVSAHFKSITRFDHSMGLICHIVWLLDSFNKMDHFAICWRGD